MQYKSPLQRLVEAAGKTGDIMLRYAYQKQMITDSLLSDAEIDCIADRVIQRISVTADVSEIIFALDEIQQKINQLEGK